MLPYSDGSFFDAKPPLTAFSAVFTRLPPTRPELSRRKPRQSPSHHPLIELFLSMWIVAIAWMYVAIMMTLAEATAPNGSILGAVITLLLYGIAPLSLVMYLMGTPMRRKARRAAEAAEAQAAAAEEAASAVQPDAGSLPPGDALAPERKET